MNAELLKKLLSEVNVILFDLDDTLVDSERIYHKIYSELNLDMKVFEEARRLVKSQLPQSHVSARNRSLYFKKYLELVCGFSPFNWKALVDKYEQLLVFYINENVHSTSLTSHLKMLSSRYKLGLVTNENLRTQMLKLTVIDPSGIFFDKIFVSEEFGVEKPNYTIIKQSVDHWKLSPSQILMIGDSVVNDLESFSKIGCPVVGTFQFRDERQAGKNFQWISSLTHICDNLII